MAVMQGVHCALCYGFTPTLILLHQVLPLVKGVEEGECSLILFGLHLLGLSGIWQDALTQYASTIFLPAWCSILKLKNEKFDIHLLKVPNGSLIEIQF